MPALDVNAMRQIAEARYNTGGARYYPKGPTGPVGGYYPGADAQQVSSRPPVTRRSR
jgi:hypothetical protein